MSDKTISYVVLLITWVMLAYWFGKWRGALNQREMWGEHMAKCNSYIFAVDDLDRWCGHASPHAKLIASHLRAHGEGLGYNTGTPVSNEVCDVQGLREQLRRLDAAASMHEGGES